MESNSLCPKCSGTLYVNIDKDLSCLMCGKTIALRRELDEVKDTRRGKRAPDKEKTTGGNVARTSKIFAKGIWGQSTPNQHRNLV